MTFVLALTEKAHTKKLPEMREKCYMLTLVVVQGNSIDLIMPQFLQSLNVLTNKPEIYLSNIIKNTTCYQY